MSGFRPKKNTMLRKALGDPKRELAIRDEIEGGAKYVFDGGIRRVPPYYFTYLTFCKQRWIGRPIYDVFCAEFRDREPDYYKRAIQSGSVLVNDKPASLQTILKNGDLISHRTHKHEQPVSSEPIRIIHEDDDLLIIDKPSGVPAHPTGRFKFNTVVSILKYEQHAAEAHPCNRLDRLTSGLMFLAKTPSGAEVIGRQIREREVRKEYLAMVKGEFPLGTQVCEVPLATVNPKVALNMADWESGKDSRTHFQRVSWHPSENVSIVKCRPFTGRTHQIRVHLQYMGYPIANDPIYSNPEVWGPQLGKEVSVQNIDSNEIIARLDNVGKGTVAKSWIMPDPKIGERLKGETCDICDTPLYTDPGPCDLSLWLHSIRYSAADDSWRYETSLPSWALERETPFMRKALDEANKCVPLESAFCVGAVLVKDEVILETGYTRELEGNTHAEQCALEKYRHRMGQDVPDGTVLYTSMEPCSYRLSGNTPCANRILSSNIKTVFVGVLEPTTFVSENVGRKKLENAGVSYVHLPGFEEEALAIAKKGHAD